MRFDTETQVYTLNITVIHMAECAQPEQKSAAGVHSKDFGPYIKGPLKGPIILSFQIYKIQEFKHQVLKEPESYGLIL